MLFQFLLIFFMIYNLLLPAVGHNADDIAETVIMNGITFYLDNFDIFKPHTGYSHVYRLHIHKYR